MEDERDGGQMHECHGGRAQQRENASVDMNKLTIDIINYHYTSL